MTEQEAEKRIDDLVHEYCRKNGICTDTIHDFLFKYGNMYKIDNILEQVEDDED